MKKDIVVAIAAGFIIGAAVALAASNLPKIISDNIKIAQKQPDISPTPVITSIPTIEFTISTPIDNSISDSKSIDIKGTTKIGKLIVIETANNQNVVEVEKSGNFESKIDLVEGANVIYLTVYDESGNSNSKTLNIYYTTEKL